MAGVRAGSLNQSTIFIYYFQLSSFSIILIYIDTANDPEFGNLFSPTVT